MVYKLEFTREARRELDQIYCYSRERYLRGQSAFEIAQDVQEAINLVLLDPEAALSFDARIGYSFDQNHELYFTVSEQFLIFFVIIDETVVIVHFLAACANNMNHLKLLFENTEERTLVTR